ncbi:MULTISPECIES: MFS transporter [Ralstonia solanacearum species complex]|uniref:MFS transporter n=1 Tax=Ralstonia solanacearum species complex TaxID=3116862 RepID=UPI000E57BCE5|nr:MFS transporter [Ralstonia solanacearum]BEU75140.1 MFS transporter [Ralstonia pseudosolanacearum]AXV79905.1 MFS transporter [Ralstonia solanacearum]AXV93940.1 MFS transporter [Ralstonia solanacearum]AXW21920.1 MFS transporter [Ralstonia solanacearum]AXW78833.1 MFS transporter [Ralstonia solanacearum]
MQDTPQRGQRSKVRWLVAGLMWAAIAINYIDRTVLSAAAPHIQKEFHLSAVEMGIVMSAFFWSYALLQLPAGILADRFGQKKVLGFAVLWWSLATAVTGLATGFKSLVSLRVALGVGEAGAYPSNAGITSRWFPKQERATVAAIFDSGSKLGSAIALPLIAWLLVAFDWKLTFAVAGSLGIVWSVVWVLVFKDSPAAHPGVNAAELSHIQKGLPPARNADAPSVSWTKLLTHRNVWAMCIGFFMINYNSYFFITWLPTYLVKERGMGLMEMGFMASLPLFVSMFVEVFAGWASDRVYASGRLSLTATRKLFLVIGLVMASSIGLAAFAQSAVVAVILLCIAKSGTTVAASQVWALPADVAPGNTVSMVAGLQNTVSNMGGVVGPIVTGAIVGATGSFIPALVFSAALIGLAIVNYLFLLGKVEPIAFEPNTATLNSNSHERRNANARA